MSAADRQEARSAAAERVMAYADPPYPRQSKAHYAEHIDYAGEVDHESLIDELRTYHAGWALSTSSTALREVWNLCPEARVAVWTKGFAAFKNQRVTFAWEPVLYVACGGTPEKVCHWLFEVMGCEPQDELHDLFPGTGAVTKAWESWRTQLRLAV